MKIKIGVLCPSEIALRRFMPALMKCEDFEFVGISSANAEEWFGEPTDELVESEKSKAKKFTDNYGGRLFESYNELLSSPEIDAVYIPLPPALHFKWAKKALENGKHVFLEKPFTTALADTEELLKIAKEKNLAVHENYMFVYHSQLDWIKNKLPDIGEIRLIRIDFGFPFRGANDFRYNKELGGGALLDCGGYTVKLAGLFLGETAKITASQLNTKSGFVVDIYGSATLTNDNGLTAQIAFGMDNSYKCSLEVWGSEGTIYTNRILTAPDGFEPVVTVKKGNEEQQFTLLADDTFAKSIKFFKKCVDSDEIRAQHYEEIRRQSANVEEILRGN
ncbi:MAG: Gfo/Idh/MocA family oxidoreductase [Oscillospiraceae bacterium]|nr:Gfo/Idh/MocA family oxidoreductase [Oscillospiraceae bacterium]